jgi:glutamine synthetase
MSYFSDLFKDKINSVILREYVEKIVREMAELKQKNYYTMLEVDKRKDEINKIEEALKEFGIPVDEIHPDTDFDDGDY